MLLRSGYKHEFQISLGGRLCTIRWKPAHQHAQWFPLPHCFSSANWLSNYESRSGVGETYAKKVWLQDRFSTGIGDGRFCGKESWFLTGIPENVVGTGEPCADCYGYSPRAGMTRGFRTKQIVKAGIAIGARTLTGFGAFTMGFSDGFDRERFV